ncbi:conserved hypothetical protein [Tenacibaculum litopenaei]|uniref:TerB family tellurite resistance protein n=1 Tax=Tenacibaculum litopenaei TaxID=396016 RepID=UPI003893F502
MSVSDLFESQAQKKNVLHFAILVKMALVDGAINITEREMLVKFARKLSIAEDQVAYILEHIDAYPLPSVAFKLERLEYLYELFQMIYSDHDMDREEEAAVFKYAIGLGFTEEEAAKVIACSIRVFGKKIRFDEYLLLQEKGLKENN